MSALTHPTGTVLGSTRPAELAAFLSIFGAQPVASVALSAEAAYALYGLNQPTRQIVMTTPGADGSIRIVETPHEAPPFTPLTRGAYGIDFFSRDLDLSMELLRAAGISDVSPLIGYGPDQNVDDNTRDSYFSTELRLQAPTDELSIFLTDVGATRNPWPTLLDMQPQRLHSETLMMVWVIDHPALARAFWAEEAGLIAVADNYPDLAQMARLMKHPSPIRMHGLNYTDAQRGRKIELLSYPDTATNVKHDWPLHGGLHAAAFEVASLERSVALLPSAVFGAQVLADDGFGLRPVVTALAPDGVRFELWQRPA